MQTKVTFPAATSALPFAEAKNNFFPLTERKGIFAVVVLVPCVVIFSLTLVTLSIGGADWGAFVRRPGTDVIHGVCNRPQWYRGVVPNGSIGGKSAGRVPASDTVFPNSPAYTVVGQTTHSWCEEQSGVAGNADSQTGFGSQDSAPDPECWFDILWFVAQHVGYDKDRDVESLIGRRVKQAD